jgi:cyclopropane fatty-acyl-phospholipid synthase-like methyltransferase
MLEHVGHEFYEDFFASCEYHLAEHGLLVLQVHHNYQYIFISSTNRYIYLKAKFISHIYIYIVHRGPRGTVRQNEDEA